MRRGATLVVAARATPPLLHAERNHASWDIPVELEGVVRLAAEGTRVLAQGSAQAAGSLPELAAGAFEGSASLLGAAGEALFDVLAFILEGIFSGLG
jgi:hypothetical protein